MSTEPDSQIVLRVPRSQKGRYVAAARAQGLTLAAWIFARLDESSQPFPKPGEESSPAPEPAAVTKPRWTPAEDARLGSVGDAELARELGRTRASVIARRLRLGVAAHALAGRPAGKSLTGQS